MSVREELNEIKLDLIEWEKKESFDREYSDKIFFMTKIVEELQDIKICKIINVVSICFFNDKNLYRVGLYHDIGDGKKTVDIELWLDYNIETDMYEIYDPDIHFRCRDDEEKVKAISDGYNYYTTGDISVIKTYLENYDFP
jgi:hypothetical protein